MLRGYYSRRVEARKDAELQTLHNPLADVAVPVGFLRGLWLIVPTSGCVAGWQREGEDLQHAPDARVRLSSKASARRGESLRCRGKGRRVRRPKRKGQGHHDIGRRRADGGRGSSELAARDAYMDQPYGLYVF